MFAFLMSCVSIFVKGSIGLIIFSGIIAIIGIILSAISMMISNIARN